MLETIYHNQNWILIPTLLIFILAVAYGGFVNMAAGLVIALVTTLAFATYSTFGKPQEHLSESDVAVYFDIIDSLSLPEGVDYLVARKGFEKTSIIKCDNSKASCIRLMTLMPSELKSVGEAEEYLNNLANKYKSGDSAFMASLLLLLSGKR